MKKKIDTLPIDRRKFLAGVAALGSGAVLFPNVHAAEGVHTHEPDRPHETPGAAERDKPLPERIDPKTTLPAGEPGKDYTPVVTPNNVSLPWKMVNGVKVYHLVAEEVEHEFAPGLIAKCWGYNGRVHGPTIEAAVRYVDALREYWVARVDLGLILAGRLPPMEPGPAAPALEQLPRFPFPALQ